MTLELQSGTLVQSFLGGVARHNLGNHTQIFGSEGTTLLSNSDERLLIAKAGEPFEGMSEADPNADLEGVNKGLWNVSVVGALREFTAAVREARPLKEGATFEDGWRTQRPGRWRGRFTRRAGGSPCLTSTRRASQMRRAWRRRARLPRRPDRRGREQAVSKQILEDARVVTTLVHNAAILVPEPLKKVSSGRWQATHRRAGSVPADPGGVAGDEGGGRWLRSLRLVAFGDRRLCR